MSGGIFTPEQQRKAIARSIEVARKRREREETEFDWDKAIARLKIMLDDLDRLYAK